MVIRDLFFSESASSAPASQPRPRLASPADRFIAAVFDFFIFSPVISFAVSGLLREVKTYLLLDARAPEAGVIWFIFLATGTFLAALLPAIFIYHWGATPGQKFLHLKVVSWPHGEDLSFGRCFLRSLLALGNLLLFGLPFLEVFTHPWRRAFHERATDTLVVTLVGKADRGPSLAERKILTAWMKMFFALILMTIFVFTGKSYVEAKRGLIAHTADLQGYACANVDQSAVDGETSNQRMDRTLALFLAGEVDEECVGKETRRALWGQSEGGLEWAYLTAAFAGGDDSTDQDAYFRKVCEVKPSSEACGLAKYFSDNEEKKTLELKDPASVTARMILLDQNLERKNYAAALAGLQSLKDLDFLDGYSEKVFVRIAWSWDHQVSGSRLPASADRDQVIRDFKEKYGVE